MIRDFSEIISYLIFGCLTTVIGLAVYYVLVFTILDPQIAWQLQAANVISWIFAVLFAFFTNRTFVFKSKSKSISSEIIKFFSARIFSLILDMLIMFIFVSVFSFNDRIVKLISQAIVIISNYVMSKFFVFNTN